MLLPCKITTTTNLLHIHTNFWLNHPNKKEERQFRLPDPQEDILALEAPLSSWPAAGGFVMVSFMEGGQQLPSVLRACVPHLGSPFPKSPIEWSHPSTCLCCSLPQGEGPCHQFGMMILKDLFKAKLTSIFYIDQKFWQFCVQVITQQLYALQGL